MVDKYFDLSEDIIESIKNDIKEYEAVTLKFIDLKPENVDNQEFFGISNQTLLKSEKRINFVREEIKKLKSKVRDL